MIVSSQRASLNKGDHFFTASPLNQQRLLTVSENSSCLSDISEKLDDDEKTNAQDTRDLMLDMIWRGDPLQTTHDDASGCLNYSSKSCFLNRIGEFDMWYNINEAHTKNKHTSNNNSALDLGSQSDLLHLNNLATPIWSMKSCPSSTSNKKRAYNKTHEEMTCDKYQYSNPYDNSSNETAVPSSVLPSTNNLITASSFVHCHDNPSNAKSFLKLESIQKHVTDEAKNYPSSLPVVSSYKKSKTCIESMSSHSSNTLSTSQDLSSTSDKKMLSSVDSQEHSISERYDSSVNYFFECWLVSLSNNVLELQLKYLKEGNEKLRHQIKQIKSESSFASFKKNNDVLGYKETNCNLENVSQQEKEHDSSYSNSQNMEDVVEHKSENIPLTSPARREEISKLPLNSQSIIVNEQKKLNLTNLIEQYVNSCDTSDSKVETETTFSKIIIENNSVELGSKNEIDSKNQHSDLCTHPSRPAFRAECHTKVEESPLQNFSTRTSCEQINKSVDSISQQTKEDKLEMEFYSNNKLNNASFYSDDKTYDDSVQRSLNSDGTIIACKTKTIFNTETKMDFSPSLLFSTSNNTSDPSLVSTTCEDSFFSEKRLESSLLTDTLSNPSPVLNNLLSRFVLCSNEKTNSFNAKRITEKNVTESECLGIFDNYLPTNGLHDMASYPESECSNTLECFTNGPESPNGNDLIDFNFVNFLQRVASPSSVLNKHFSLSLTTDLYSMNDETDTFRTNDSVFHYHENNSDSSLSSINNSWNCPLSSEEFDLSSKSVSNITTPLKPWNMDQSLNSLLCCDSDDNKMALSLETISYQPENRQKRIGPSCFRRPKTPSRITNFSDGSVPVQSCSVSPTGSCLNSMPRMIPILTPPTAMNSTRAVSPKPLSQSHGLTNDCEISSDIVDSTVKLPFCSINKNQRSTFSIQDAMISPPVISNSFLESPRSDPSCPRSDTVKLPPYFCTDTQDSHMQHCLVHPSSSRVKLPTSSSLVVLSYPPQEPFEVPTVDRTNYDAAVSKPTTNSRTSTAISPGQVISSDQDELQSLPGVSYDKMISWNDSHMKLSESSFFSKTEPFEFSSNSHTRWPLSQSNLTGFSNSVVASNKTHSESTLRLSYQNKLRNYNGMTSNDLLSFESVNKNPLIHQIH
ncbi:uncharacterized protein LOC128883674 isoform X2 [Hylaeus volcanicus]|uniref:uncharacterized protein LOC128883674 isoform X2 n=1 Tax=Hylaeus volcanicus TaxID=313075 RepID=UPI0023B8299B|nr:uncharacterized protein LOC128883674 isoform X2 [Hylaeus volcanicus]